MQSRTSSEIKLEIESQMGFFPPFFEPAFDSPVILENLWQQTLNGYIKNPLPELFKEQLAASLARYCSVPYCLLCHSSALRPLGMGSSDVLCLLQQEPPTADELAQQTQKFHTLKLDKWPAAGSEVEIAIFNCCVAIFLNQDTESCQEKLQAALPAEFYNHLTLYLAYNRTALTWAEAHPELNYQSDERVKKHYDPLITTDPRLADFFANYKDRVKEQTHRRTYWLTQENKALFENEKALRVKSEANESLVRNLLNSTAEGIWGMDTAGLITLVNPSAVKLFGYSIADEMIGKNSHELVHHSYPDGSPYPMVDCPIHKSLKSGKAIHLENELLWKKNGTSFFATYSSTPLFENGIITGAVVTFLDTTDQKAAAEELKIAKDRAELANASKSAFLANMSHEIRSPLGAILGFTDLLKDARLTGEEREYLDIILRSGKALTHVIDDILDLSKVEAGKLGIENIPLVIKDLVKDVVSLFSDQARSKNITLNFTSKLNAVTVILSDPVRIRQVIVNLLGNALKFTSSGSVNVTLGSNVLTATTSKFLIRITDTGSGLSALQAEKLFRPFSQADESTTRKFGGTGLGLALSKRLANALSGDVTIEKSALGMGSTFLFEITAELSVSESTETLQITAQPFSNARPKRLANHKVLIVDDSPDNRILITHLLKKEGALVSEASSGSEGVTKALSDTYDIILMDIQMPGIDGYEALRILLKLHYDVPVIALTAHAMIEERQRTLSAGFADHITKPIDINSLVNSIVKTSRHTSPLV